MRRVTSCPEFNRKRTSVRTHAFPHPIWAYELATTPVTTFAQCHIQYGVPELVKSAPHTEALAVCLALPDEPPTASQPVFNPKPNVIDRLEQDASFKNRYIDWHIKVRMRRRRKE